MKRAIILLVFLGSMCACGDANKPVVSNNSITLTPTPQPAQDLTDTELQKKFEEIAAASKGIVGAAALRFDTGETASVNGDGRFPMQSVYKLPIALTVFKQAADGKVKHGAKIAIDKEIMVGKDMHSPIRDKFPDGTTMPVDDVVRYSVSESDGTASDVLMKLVGGPDAVQEYLSSVGVADMKVRNTEKELGLNHPLQYENWATPLAAVKLLKTLESSIPNDGSKESVLMKYLRETRTGTKRLKGKLPADATVYHKTGTSWTENGVTAATNDIGIICFPNGKCAAVAVFVKDSDADEAGREEAIAKIAKAVWDAWSEN